MTIELLDSLPPWEWPEDAGETIRKTLLDANAPLEQRITAAQLGGDVTVANDEMARALLSVLRDRAYAAELRAQAAIAFGAPLELSDWEADGDIFGEEPNLSQPVVQEIQSALRSVYEDKTEPKLVRRRALEASVRLAEPWHEDAVRAALAAGDDEWTLTAVFCMRWVQGDFKKEILRFLDHPNPRIQCEAVQAAGAQEIGAAWPRVRSLLSSSRTSRDLLLAAIEAAPNIRMEEARDLLEDLAESDDEEIAEAAQEALDLAAPDDFESEEDEEE